MIGIKKQAAATRWVQVARERDPTSADHRPSSVGFALPRDLNPRPIICSFV
jgi:hypothetical protein